MTKRQAKKHVLWLASVWLDSNMGEGACTAAGLRLADLRAGDEERLDDAMLEVIAELRQRGGEGLKP